MAFRKKKKTLRKKTGRRKTGIPVKKHAFSIALRKYIPFIVMAAAAALILLFLWAQSRVNEPRKLKIGSQGVEAGAPSALETVEEPPVGQDEAGAEPAGSPGSSSSETP